MWSERGAGRVRGVACALLLLALGCAPARPEHLVLVVLDTVRRDHLPTYGYPRETAPRIDALARRSVVFENAFAQQTNTGPSHASMFTGLYPHVHGSRFNGVPLPPERITLAEILRDSGFRTAAFVSGVTMRAAACGLDGGFEVYDDEFRGKRRDGRIATERAMEWLRRHPGAERKFLFLHLYDAHGPYTPAGPYANLFRSTEEGPTLRDLPPYQVVRDPQGRPLAGLNGYVDRYDAMIRYQDDLVARLLDAVDLERTVVVILSDHGETLGERYRPLDHGGQAFDEQIRIPFVLSSPGTSPRRVAALVETVDLLPTLLDLLDVPLPAPLEVEGRTLVPLLRGEAAPSRPFVFAQARSVSERHADRGYRLQPRTNLSTVRGPRWKLILYPGVERDYLELYDLAADPGERSNVAEAEPRARDLHLRVLREWLRVGAAAPGAPPLSPELRRQLEELGYVD